MRKIKIYQRDSQLVELFDDSDMNFDDYCKELSKLFSISNISILKTNKQTFIGRPSQITGIVVEDDDIDDNSLLIDGIDEIEDTDNTPEETKKEPEISDNKDDSESIKEDPDVDIITDMD
jgi:hypothetical protein